ncbi:MAG TPA: amidohydrolase family protein [Streptosporangiaceae bacterium]|nr:amidohydrolase family protein [Streptosporangiaceae bacterium]
MAILETDRPCGPAPLPAKRRTRCVSSGSRSTSTGSARIRTGSPRSRRCRWGCPRAARQRRPGHRIDTQLNPLAGLPRPVIWYLTQNVWYTTSGYFFDDQFALTRAMFGDDRVMFSVDYPFEDNRQAREWFNHLDLPAAVREKMAHGTADQLLRLPV